MTPNVQPQDIAALLERAARLFGVPILAMLSSRCRRFMPARQAAMLALRRAGYTVVEIGKLFNRDHTTICYHTKAAEQRAAIEPRYAAQLAALLSEPEPPAREITYPATPSVRLCLAFWGVAAPLSA